MPLASKWLWMTRKAGLPFPSRHSISSIRTLLMLPRVQPLHFEVVQCLVVQEISELAGAGHLNLKLQMAASSIRSRKPGSHCPELASIGNGQHLTDSQYDSDAGPGCRKGR